MNPEVKDLLKPEILNSIEGLELISKILVEGYFVGSNVNQKVGGGLEFSQYRSYEVGDDLRLLDWKMYARSERYYVRQAEIDTNIRIRFFLDASASMLHEDEGMSKMDYARLLIASLGYLGKKQGDEIGLFALNTESDVELQPGFSTQHFQRFLYELIKIKPEGRWPISRDQWDNIQMGKDKEMLIFVSDLYEKGNELTSFIKKLKTPRNEVIVFHLMSENELTFDFEKNASFRDLESGVKINASKNNRQAYIARIEEHIHRLRTDFANAEIDYELFNISRDIEKLIGGFLKRRRRLN